jgi:hypothetical protein
MGSFDQSFSSSPVLVLPPTQPSFKMNPNRPAFTSPFTNGNSPLPSTSASSNLTPISLPPSAAGRKRSRDEAASNLEEDYFPVQAPIIEKEPKNEEEWEYGEGMTLIKPNVGYIMEAESQTGTWAEEKAEEEKAQAAQLSSSPERPILRAAKSQRLDLTATPSIAEEVSSDGTFVAAGSPERTSGNEPTVDDFTRHLGIGWSSINADEDIQAAVRGWTKFIENHFPVTDAKIRLQSRGLASYLVEANEGYFLFGEDLKQGRLVSTSLEKTWVNLRGPAPMFDGESVMEAVESPKLNAGTQPMIDEHAVMNGMEGGIGNGDHVTAGQTVEVEMDMS